MTYCTVKIICTSEEFPLLAQTLLNVPLLGLTQEKIPETEHITTAEVTEPSREVTKKSDLKKYKQKKYFCPVPDCERTTAVYLHQHLRNKHKMKYDEMKKWTKIAKTV